MSEAEIIAKNEIDKFNELVKISNNQNGRKLECVMYFVAACLTYILKNVLSSYNRVSSSLPSILIIIAVVLIIIGILKLFTSSQTVTLSDLRKAHLYKMRHNLVTELYPECELSYGLEDIKKLRNLLPEIKRGIIEGFGTLKFKIGEEFGYGTEVCLMDDECVVSFWGIIWHAKCKNQEKASEVLKYRLEKSEYTYKFVNDEVVIYAPCLSIDQYMNQEHYISHNGLRRVKEYGYREITVNNVMDNVTTVKKVIMDITSATIDVNE